ncbi:MAG: hypothetical protein JRI23_07460 [Deltaproteobacteria bacterium]|nr:hypothetical protein [Deltaproteobacteria bacterium]MBW2531430.1 hypothetical protein [Deltaproteobacteria bacterium]
MVEATTGSSEAPELDHHGSSSKVATRPLDAGDDAAAASGDGSSSSE